MLQSISGGELGITKPLGLHLHLVLDDADICAFAPSKEVGDIGDGGIKRKVSEMYGVRWLVWEGEFFANRVA